MELANVLKVNAGKEDIAELAKHTGGVLSVNSQD